MTLPIEALLHRILRRRRSLMVVPVVCGLLLGCTPTDDPQVAPATGPSVDIPSTSGPPTAADSPEPGTFPPPWLGTRELPLGPDGFGKVLPTPPALRWRRFTLPDTVKALPGQGFASRVDIAPVDVISRSTWAPDCPIAAADLAWLRVTFWGFDDARHTGELLVDVSVAQDVVRVFRRLYAARFPLEQLRIATQADLDAAPTGDGNGTGSFVCRPVVGQSTFSEHAYGLAIDVNPFQNPYVKGDLVLPELASAYLDRDRDAPGMIGPDSVVVRAFADIGWSWGGDFRTLKDYQHFSLRGR